MYFVLLMDFISFKQNFCLQLSLLSFNSHIIVSLKLGYYKFFSSVCLDVWWFENCVHKACKCKGRVASGTYYASCHETVFIFCYIHFLFIWHWASKMIESWLVGTSTRALDIYSFARTSAHLVNVEESISEVWTPVVQIPLLLMIR